MSSTKYQDEKDEDVNDPDTSTDDSAPVADVDPDSPAVADNTPPVSQTPSPDAQTTSPTPQTTAPDQAAQVPQTPQTTPDQAAATPPDQAAAQTPQTAAVLTPVSSQDLKNEDAKTANDLASGQITPETYHSLFAKKDTLGKIGTIFGLLLSGAGSGLAHQPNALLDMMNREISNDLDAQKSSATNAQNLIKINQANELNKSNIGLNAAQQKLALADANIKTDALSHMQASRIFLHKLTMDVNKYPVGTPERQQAEQKLALLYNSVDAMNSNLADKAEASSALAHAVFASNNPNANGQPSSEEDFQKRQQLLRLSGNSALADVNESRHMPGIPGASSTPLTGEDRSQITSAQQLIGSLNRLKQFSVNNPHPLPGSTADKEGRALAAQVQGDFRQATHGGVFKEGEQNFINQVIPGDPTTINPFAKVVPKINTVINETAARNLQFLKAKGFPIGGKQQQPQAPQAQPVASNEPTTKVMNGATYQRVSGGWQKVGGSGSSQSQWSNNASAAGTD